MVCAAIAEAGPRRRELLCEVFDLSLEVGLKVVGLAAALVPHRARSPLFALKVAPKAPVPPPPRSFQPALLLFILLSRFLLLATGRWEEGARQRDGEVHGVGAGGWLREVSDGKSGRLTADACQNAPRR